MLPLHPPHRRPTLQRKESDGELDLNGPGELLRSCLHIGIASSVGEAPAREREGDQQQERTRAPSHPKSSEQNRCRALFTSGAPPSTPDILRGRSRPVPLWLTWSVGALNPSDGVILLRERSLRSARIAAVTFPRRPSPVRTADARRCGPRRKLIRLPVPGSMGSKRHHSSFPVGQDSTPLLPTLVAAALAALLPKTQVVNRRG